MRDTLLRILFFLVLIYSVVIATMQESQAADVTAQTISNMTGWSVEDVQIVLKEDIRNDWEVTEEQAETLLLGEMQSYGADFCNGSVKFEVMASISALETGHFEDVYQNNVGGIVDLSGEYQTYDTLEAGIQDMDRLLTEQYLDPDGLYYVEEDFTIVGLSKHYNTRISWLAGYCDVRLSLQRRIDDVSDTNQSSLGSTLF